MQRRLHKKFVFLCTMLHLYIDTNAYLTFYHLSNEDLEELKKLRALIKHKKIVLHLPEHTIDEFERNREVKIADALKKFKEEKLNNIFPQICKHHTEYEKMIKAIRDFNKNKDILLNNLMEEVESQSLPADGL